MKLLPKVATALSVALFLTGCSPHPDLNSVKEGTADLVCTFKDGTRQVPKEKILTFNDDRSRWVFVNGSVHASNCKVFPHAR